MAHAPTNQPNAVFEALPERDFDALETLSLLGYRFATCRHLTSLHYRSGAECRLEMERLHRQGLVWLLRVPDIRRSTWGEEIYTLSGKGALLLAGRLGLHPARLAGRRPRSPIFLEHAIKVSDFRHALELGLRGTDVHLLLWMNEWELRQRRTRAVGAAGARLPVIPDGVFSLERRGRREFFFLEADRGTMRMSAMDEKFQAYVAMYRQGLHRARLGFPHFRALTVTTTAARRHRLEALIRKIGHCLNMFLFTTYRERMGDRRVDNVSPERILRPIWHAPADSRIRSLLDS